MIAKTSIFEYGKKVISNGRFGLNWATKQKETINFKSAFFFAFVYVFAELVNFS